MNHTDQNKMIKYASQLKFECLVKCFVAFNFFRFSINCFDRNSQTAIDQSQERKGTLRQATKTREEKDGNMKKERDARSVVLNEMHRKIE